jgi:transposase
VCKVADELGVSRNTVYKWWRRFKATGEVNRKPGSGRKRLIDQQTEDMVLDIIAGSDSHSADQASKHLHAEGVLPHLVHRSTIIRAARRAAQRSGEKLWVQRGKPPKAMTEGTKEKRLAFAANNQNTNWAHVLFTDRKKFHFRFPGSKVKPVRWIRGAAKTSQAAVYQPNKPQCVNIYAGICKYGVTAAHVVAGSSKHTSQHKTKKGQQARNITASEYKEVLTGTLLPEGRRLFSVQGISTWTLQQDNDPTHKQAPAVVKQWNEEHSSSVQVLAAWPPNSPDLNPIENVWAWVQQEVDKLGCSTFEEFKQAVLDKLAAVPQGHLVNLCDSMKDRLDSVIEMGGGPTKY